MTEEIKVRYECKKCNINTCNKKDYTRHLKTKKHEFMISNAYPKNPNIANIYQCMNCEQLYKNNSGLWKHKKKCKMYINHDECNLQSDSLITPDFLLEFIKQNKELQNTLVEQNQDLQNRMIELAKNQTVTNNNNNTNNQFNLQFFLNETCKDAINITDFINSLQLQVKDFENTGRLGFVEGISRIILNGLNVMDESKRPVHCTDAKRETIYIKDKDTWEKENPDKRRLKWAINRVAQLNFNQLPNWQKENPECFDISTKTNEEYLHLSLTALGGKGKAEEDKFMDKIMRNVLKKVTI